MHDLHWNGCVYVAFTYEPLWKSIKTTQIGLFAHNAHARKQIKDTKVVLFGEIGSENKIKRQKIDEMAFPTGLSGGRGEEGIGMDSEKRNQLKIVEMSRGEGENIKPRSES